MRDDRFHITIVVADDSHDSCVLIREALLAEKLADRVQCVANGEELMNYLEDSPVPDLIILDLEMPHKDGRQALKEMRCDEKLENIPVAILSGSVKEEDKQLVNEPGVVAYIEKPETLPGLFKAVRSLRSQVVGWQ